MIKGLTEKEYHAAYRKANRVVIAYQQRAFQRKLRASDPDYLEKKRIYAREYYKKNQSKLQEYHKNYNKQYKLKNKEKNNEKKT